MRIPAVVTLVSLIVGLASGSASAQIPTATGRAINLSTTGYRLFIPDNYVHRPQDATDLLVHFHGDPQTVWNNAKYANLNAVILTVNLGAGSSSYQTPYTSSALFGNILTEARNVVRSQADFSDTLNFDKLGVSSFSAGYAAVREILKTSSYYNDIDGMVLADTVYAGFTSGGTTPNATHMADFRKFALAAKNGTKTLTLSHSKVLTYTYSNTEETADDLMAWVGVTPTAYNATGISSPIGPLTFYRKADTGNFTVFGATGADANAHSKHLQTMGQFLVDLPLSTVPEPVGLAIVALAITSVLPRRRRV